MDTKREKEQGIASSLAWKTIEQYSVFGLQFILQIVLARILSPDNYGVLAIANVFIVLSNVFIQNGFATAIVRNEEIEESDISSVFIISITIAIALYTGLFNLSPILASFYNMAELTELIRLMSLSLFFGAYSSILNSLIRRQMRFKESFLANFSSVLISGILGIITAICDMGVWALAVQQISYSFLTMVFLAIIIRWRPKILFSLSRVKSLFQFGWKVLLTSLLDQLFVEYRNLFIGKVYSPSSLSFYNRGKQFPNLLVQGINGSLQAVMLPAFSKIQSDKQAVADLLHIAINSSAYIVFPLLAGLAFVAPSLISLLLTDKWLPCVPFIWINCVFYITWPFTTMSCQALYALGKSGTVLGVESARKAIDFIVLMITINYTVEIVAIGAAAVSIAFLPIYIVLVRRHIGYSIKKQTKGITLIFIGTAFMSLALFGIGLLPLDSIILLPLQIIAGVVVYISWSRALKLEGFLRVKGFLEKTLKRKVQFRGES